MTDDINAIFRNEEISAIAFVRDYVEICCEERVLRIFSSLSLTKNGSRFQFPDTSAIVPLVSLIGETIVRVLKTEDAFTLTTREGSAVQIPIGKSVSGETLMVSVPRQPPIVI
jgi:hypothetical protein